MWLAPAIIACDQGQHLAAGTGTADAPDQAHRGVDQRLQLEPRRQRRDEQQPGVGDQVRLIEDDVNVVQTVRYSRCHWKCLLAWLQRRRRTPSLSQLRRPFWWMRDRPQPASIGGSSAEWRRSGGCDGGGMDNPALHDDVGDLAHPVKH